MPDLLPADVPGPDAHLAADQPDALRRTIAELVVRHPGVVRIEPTLASALRALGEDHDPADAVRCSIRSGVVDIELSLAAAGHQARDLAHRLRAAIVTSIADRGLVPGSVEIHVLAIERVSTRTTTM